MHFYNNKNSLAKLLNWEVNDFKIALDFLKESESRGRAGWNLVKAEFTGMHE